MRKLLISGLLIGSSLQALGSAQTAIDISHTLKNAGKTLGRFSHAPIPKIVHHPLVKPEAPFFKSPLPTLHSPSPKTSSSLPRFSFKKGERATTFNHPWKNILTPINTITPMQLSVKDRLLKNIMENKKNNSEEMVAPSTFTTMDEPTPEKSASKKKKNSAKASLEDASLTKTNPADTHRQTSISRIEYPILIGGHGYTGTSIMKTLEAIPANKIKQIVIPAVKEIFATLAKHQPSTPPVVIPDPPLQLDIRENVPFIDKASYPMIENISPPSLPLISKSSLPSTQPSFAAPIEENKFIQPSIINIPSDPPADIVTPLALTANQPLHTKEYSIIINGYKYSSDSIIKALVATPAAKVKQLIIPTLKEISAMIGAHPPPIRSEALIKKSEISEVSENSPSMGKYHLPSIINILAPILEATSPQVIKQLAITAVKEFFTIMAEYTPSFNSNEASSPKNFIDSPAEAPRLTYPTPTPSIELLEPNTSKYEATLSPTPLVSQPVAKVSSLPLVPTPPNLTKAMEVPSMPDRHQYIGDLIIKTLDATPAAKIKKAVKEVLTVIDIPLADPPAMEAPEPPLLPVPLSLTSSSSQPATEVIDHSAKNDLPAPLENFITDFSPILTHTITPSPNPLVQASKLVLATLSPLSTFISQNFSPLAQKLFAPPIGQQAIMPSVSKPLSIIKPLSINVMKKSFNLISPVEKGEKLREKIQTFFTNVGTTFTQLWNQMAALLKLPTSEVQNKPLVKPSTINPQSAHPKFAAFIENPTKFMQLGPIQMRNAEKKKENKFPLGEEENTPQFAQVLQAISPIKNINIVEPSLLSMNSVPYEEETPPAPAFSYGASSYNARLFTTGNVVKLGLCSAWGFTSNRRPYRRRRGFFPFHNKG